MPYFLHAMYIFLYRISYAGEKRKVCCTHDCIYSTNLDQWYAQNNKGTWSMPSKTWRGGFTALRFNIVGLPIVCIAFQVIFKVLKREICIGELKHCKLQNCLLYTKRWIITVYHVLPWKGIDSDQSLVHCSISLCVIPRSRGAQAL